MDQTTLPLASPTQPLKAPALTPEAALSGVVEAMSAASQAIPRESLLLFLADVVLSTTRFLGGGAYATLLRLIEEKHKEEGQRGV